MTHKISPVVAIVLVVVCVAIVVGIYYVTLGRKVSRQTAQPPAGPGPAPAVEQPGPGGLTPVEGSHARPAGTANPTTKPAGDKKPSPPGG